MIVDPWGNILDRLPRGSGVVVAGINADYQNSLRASLPALKHRTHCTAGIPGLRPVHRSQTARLSTPKE
jgi:predicted amidohydrolase